MTAREVGFNGESEAVKFLESLGFKVLERNFRTRYGELDIIAKAGDYIIFAEVKTRKNNNFANAAESVTPSKQRKLKLAARQWLAARACEAPARFDVIEVYKNGDINHIDGAFQ